MVSIFREFYPVIHRIFVLIIHINTSTFMGQHAFNPDPMCSPCVFSAASEVVRYRVGVCLC